jgi:hypothetical protein
MPFPLSPANNQVTLENGIAYTYNSSRGAWYRTPVTALTSVTSNNFTVLNSIIFSDGTTQTSAASPNDSFARTTANTATNNITILQGVNTDQNTRITISEGVDVGQNTRMTIIEGVDTTQNTRMSIIEGVNTAQNTNITAADTKAQAAFDKANTSITTSGGTISGSLSVTGNLTVLGTTTTINTASLTVNDSLIQLGVGNFSSDLLDIGVSGHYNDGTNAQSGIIRDATTKEWYVFKGYTPELSANNNININHASFVKANVHADFFKGNVVFPDGTVQATAVNLRMTGGTTAPTSPTVGDLWYDTDIDVLLRYTNDGTSNNWVDITGPTIGRSSYIRPTYLISANVA